MSFLTPAKKSLIAVALVTPLALAACGSDDNDDSKKAAATTASKSSEDKSADKSEDKDADKSKDKDKDKDKDKEKEKDQNKDGENKDAAAGAEGQEGEDGAGEGPDQLANPLNNGEVLSLARRISSRSKAARTLMMAISRPSSSWFAASTRSIT